MEPALLGIVLDSSVLIEAERQRLGVSQLLEHVSAHIGDRTTALCCVSVAELAHGIYRADTPERRRARRRFLDDLKSSLPVYPITSETAEAVGKITAELSQRGVKIPFDDLLIGACALERSFAVATRNYRHFRDIPGLQLISI